MVSNKIILEDIFSYLESKTRELNNSDNLISSILLKKYKFDNTFLRKNRASIEVDVLAQLKNSREKTKQINKKKKERVSFVKEDEICDSKWPICILDINYRNKIMDHLVLRTYESEISLINNYFYDLNRKPVFIINRNNNINFKNILIERKVHICSSDDKIKEEDLDEDIHELYDFEEKHVFRHRSYGKYIKEDNVNYSNFISNINNKCNSILIT